MQPPEQVLAAKMPSGAKAVLVAMWRLADTEPPWIAAREREIAEAVDQSPRTIRRWIAFLRHRGAIRKERREVLARRFDGHGLSRVVPLQRTKLSSATDKSGRADVAKREETHKPPVDPVGADLAQICKHARRGDSHVQICERLLKARAKCSEGVWHKVKVFRRIEWMAGELGLAGKGLRAGEVVERWKKTR